MGVLDGDGRRSHEVRAEVGGDQGADLLQVDLPAGCAPGAGGDPADRGVGAQFRAGDVRARLAEHLGARSGQSPYAEDVRQRPGHGEQPGLVSKQPSDLGFELVDRRILVVDVITKWRLSHRREHPGGRPGDGV